jgi:hypothetical protein
MRWCQWRNYTQEETIEEEGIQNKQQDDAVPKDKAKLSNENESAGLPHAADDTVARMSTRASKSTSQKQAQTNNETTTGDPPDSKSAANRGSKKKCVE